MQVNSHSTSISSNNMLHGVLEIDMYIYMLLQILEIGCGNGVFTRRLVQLEASKHIIATDFSESQLSHARFRNQSATSQGIKSEPPLVEFRNVDAVKGDGAFLPHYPGVDSEEN